MRRPVRVLWLIKSLGPGGAERLLLEHARLGDRDLVQPAVAFLLTQKRHLVPAFDELGVATTCLDVHTIADPRWMPRLARLLRTGDFDVVHVHSPALAALARPLLRWRGRRPAIVYTEHNRWPSYHVVTRLANRATLGLDDATLAVSEDAKASMTRRGTVEVVEHGVDVEGLRRLRAGRDELRAELGVPEGHTLALTVANLRRDKAYPDLLAAARLVVDAGLAVHFVAIGQGQLEEELRVLHDRMRLGDHFRFLGYVPDAARYVAAADLFVLASVHEGRPVAVMEAVALGVPVVATRVGGIPDLVVEGRSGLLVAPHDPPALAAAIERASEPAVRDALAAGTLEIAPEVDARTAVSRLDRLYAELADARSS